MDWQAVHDRAEAHAAANVDGDMARAASDLTDEARQNIGPVARRLPRPMTAAEVLAVEPGEPGRFVARIRFSGPDSEAVVESVWVESGGRPMIAETRIV